MKSNELLEDVVEEEADVEPEEIVLFWPLLLAR